jgi:pantetheine-phosphate adenylyltransferase
VIQRALLVFDVIVVGLGVNGEKPGLFKAEERIQLMKDVLGKIRNVEVLSYEGLTANFAKKVECSHLVRGLRDGFDFSFEMRAAQMNRHLAPSIETVFIPSSPEYSNVSSSLIKEVAMLGGDVSEFLPPIVAKALAKKLKMKSC